MKVSYYDTTIFERTIDGKLHDGFVRKFEIEIDDSEERRFGSLRCHLASTPEGSYVVIDMIDEYPEKIVTKDLVDMILIAVRDIFGVYTPFITADPDAVIIRRIGDNIELLEEEKKSKRLHEIQTEATDDFLIVKEGFL